MGGNRENTIMLQAMRPLLTTLALSALAACASSSPPPPAAPVPICPTTPAVAVAPAPSAKPKSLDDVKDDVLRDFDASDAQALFDLFAPDMKTAVPLDKVKSLLPSLRAQKGRVTAAKRVSGAGGAEDGEYLLTAERGQWRLELHIDESAKIVGIRFSEPAQGDPAVARSDIRLALPFHGRWTVFWGGDRPEVNTHVTFPSQRRAADLVITGEDGRTFKTDGQKNEDYLAYGQDILAAADGVVSMVVDGVPDNVPGSMDPYMAPGNVVFIRHTPSVYSVYAHLQPGSARVKVGGKVKQGEIIGRCGNSGNSSEPHLHFQLEDGPLFEKSWGVEPLFRDVTVTRRGKTDKIADYTFLKGDTVEGAAAPRAPASTAKSRASAL
jgi:murein DD-endopeptidase MepM/ murein hydrolase activator NlpD